MTPLIVGNWKMNGLRTQIDEIRDLATAVKRLPRGLDILICPPATLIREAVDASSGKIRIGGQNCHDAISGPFTGDISAEMLSDAGATAVILGHSERRQHHGETDAIVATKATAAHRAGLLAIICIGETADQRGAGHAQQICAHQIAASVPGNSPSTALSIAYEPLWAIGSGDVPSMSHIAHMHTHIRQALILKLGANGRHIPILYGGSVDASNARAILQVAEVGGVLVGHESLDTKVFEAIIAIASQTAPVSQRA